MPKSANVKQSSICSRMRDGRPYFYCWIAGKQHGLGFDREAADRKYAELLLSKPKPELVAPSWPEQNPGLNSATEAAPVMVAHVLREFLVWHMKRVKPATYNHDARHLIGLAKNPKSFVPLAQFVGEMTVDEFGEHVVVDWADSISSKDQASYRYNLIRSVKKAFRWACSGKSGNLLAKNPVAELELPTPKSREVEISDDQWKVIEATATEPVLSLLIVLKETGARPQELREATGENLQPNNGKPRLFFREPVKKTRGEPKPRIVYLPPRSCEICQRLAERFPNSPLFRNEKGTEWTKTALNTWCKRHLSKKKLGFRFYPYALRHTFCTTKLRAGVAPAKIAVAMGTSLEMVMRVYNNLGLNENDAWEAAIA